MHDPAGEKRCIRVHVHKWSAWNQKVFAEASHGKPCALGSAGRWPRSVWVKDTSSSFTAVWLSVYAIVFTFALLFLLLLSHNPHSFIIRISQNFCCKLHFFTALRNVMSHECYHYWYLNLLIAPAASPSHSVTPEHFPAASWGWWLDSHTFQHHLAGWVQLCKIRLQCLCGNSFPMQVTLPAQRSWHGVGTGQFWSGFWLLAKRVKEPPVVYSVIKAEWGFVLLSGKFQTFQITSLLRICFPEPPVY